ncbi:hypothetical protein BJ165DRAFT_1534715 [Panaeolus papilionaceus]|nr:hypothetical protein BJ165DRAFT_1534715 [Panaeolus papilionaceus]
MLPSTPNPQPGAHWTEKRSLSELDFGQDYKSSVSWSRYTSPRHHCLMDTTTHKPATLSLVVRNFKDNMGLVQSPPRRGQSTRNMKLWCVGGQPEFTGADRYWEKCMDELNYQLNTFCNDKNFSYAVDGYSRQPKSLNVDDGIKFHHPITGTLYGIECDDLYCTFAESLPKAFKKCRRGPIKPLPAYDLSGNVIRPSNYRSVLANATIEVVFTLHHFYFEQPEKSHSFIARPVEIRVVDPSSLPYSLSLYVPPDPADTSDSSDEDLPTHYVFKRAPLRSPSPFDANAFYKRHFSLMLGTPDIRHEGVDAQKLEEPPFKRARLGSSSSIKLEDMVQTFEPAPVHSSSSWRSPYVRKVGTKVCLRVCMSFRVITYSFSTTIN